MKKKALTVERKAEINKRKISCIMELKCALFYELNSYKMVQYHTKNTEHCNVWINRGIIKGTVQRVEIEPTTFGARSQSSTD